MKKVLVVLGASSDQLFLIHTAKAMGLEVIAIDMDPVAVGFVHADDHAVISTRDVRRVLKYLESINGNYRRIRGIITMGSEISDIIAILCRELNLPGISVASARAATNKLKMKKRFKESGIPIPWFKEVRNVKELEHAFLEKKGPLVIKPVDRSGSRGVFLCSGEDDLKKLYGDSRHFSYCKRVMVEEYLPGPQISTETIIYQGQGVTPGFADRNYELLDRYKPQILENGGWMPSKISSDSRQQIEKLVENAARALGILDGVAKGDVVLTPDGPKMIEMATRLSGGDFCESLVPLGIGVNYVEAAVKIAIGEKPDLDALRAKSVQCVANRYFFPETGILKRIEGVEKVLNKDWIKKMEFYYDVGDVVPPPLSHAHRFGVFVVVGRARQQVDERVKWVYETIKIRCQPA